MYGNVLGSSSSPSDNDVTKMEGCPRSLMLNVDLKETFPTEFTPALKSYIREHYNEDADSYNNECSQLEQLRSASLRPSRDHSGCSTLRRYYAQLQFLQSRFPMEDGGTVNVQFTWTDLYSEEPIALCDAKFEQAAVLHNLAALHSQLGCNEDRTTEEGMKVACTHFQAAAGIFQYLKAGSFCKVEHFIDNFASDAVFDMASALLQMYANVMLGQAQECLLEKSILDSRKDSLIARISMQVYDYYNQALQFLDSQGPSYMGSRKAKMWAKILKIKCCQFLVVSYIYMSNNADENQKFGEKVAYLKAASQKITEAQKTSKGQPERTQELLQFLVDVVSNKLQGAVKDNDFIYHEVVPELDALPEIKAAPLVKPIPFQPNDPSVSGPDIFQRLVPMGAHTDSSLYSEEKAKLLRRYVGSIENKNHLLRNASQTGIENEDYYQHLSKALSDLHIDDLLEPEGYDVLPDAIKQKSSSLKTGGNLTEAENNMEELTKVGFRVEELLLSLSKILEEDKKREEELQELAGPMTAPPERESFIKELEQCQESHRKAIQTNGELLKVFQEHKHNLDLLAGPPEGLLAALPSHNIIDTPIDDGAVQRLRNLISKVEEMKTQRKHFEADLRQQLEEDDITQLLVTREEGNKTLFFEEQLKKHDAICDLIQKNLDAQDKILKALTEANAKYAPTRQAVKETSQRREDTVQTFILSHDTFFELKGKLSRGLRFYEGLEKTVLKLDEKLKNFAERRKKELDKITEKEKAKRADAKPKIPPSRPGAEKPQHLVNPPPSRLPTPLNNPYAGVPRMPHPGMIPGAPNPSPQGNLFQPRIPSGVFPPGAPSGAQSPIPVDPRVLSFRSEGISPSPPVLPGDPRMRAAHPGNPPQAHQHSRNQENFPEQRVPQVPASLRPGTSMHPSMQAQSVAPFSQVGPRGPGPNEHLIHSTPKMSYPVPEGPSRPPVAVPPGAPGGPYQPSQQPQTQLIPGQVAGPGSAQGLPSYDQAKLIPGSQSIDRPPQQGLLPMTAWTQGKHQAPPQLPPSGPQVLPNQLNHPPTLSPQQQFQGPRAPHPTSQPQRPSQGGGPQMYQQAFPSSQMSQPLQPAPRQHQPKNWQTHPFQFPKLAQNSVQPVQPRQQFQQAQQPYQRQPQPQPQFHQPLPGQHPLQPPLQPQKVHQSQSQFPQNFQGQLPTRPQQKPQQPPHFQQQQFQQPPPRFEQPIPPFQHPAQFQPQSSQPQQQIQPPRDPTQATQFQPAQHQKGLQQQWQQQPPQPLQPTPVYQPQLQQPLQPTRPQLQSNLQPRLPSQPRVMQPPPLGEQFQGERLSQQTANQGQPPSQKVQTSLGSLTIQQGSRASEIVPQVPPKMVQTPGQLSQQQESSGAFPKAPTGYPAQQPNPGRSPGQQLSQSSNTSTQLGYPQLPEKKRSQTDQLSSVPPQEGYPAPHTGLQRPVVMQSSPQQLNTSAGSSPSWPYPHVSQPMPTTNTPQQYSRQHSKDEQQRLEGKQSTPHRQSSMEQTCGSLGSQQVLQDQLRQEQRGYPPSMVSQNSPDFNKQSQYHGQSGGRLGFYPSYGGRVSELPTSSLGGSQPYSFSPVSAPTAPPLVQGVRPSHTSLPPSSAYATSYSVSVAQAQLSQQQQMQQLQTQMLLQQQQLIIQQQELLRHQQQQQQHESDQGQLTQLFQQVLQQQSKLAEMEQKLSEHDRVEEKLKKEHEKEDHGKPSSEERDKGGSQNGPEEPEKDRDIAEKTLHTDKEGPHSASSPISRFNASWGLDFSDGAHGKLDMEQVFGDLAKKQISEISDMSTAGRADSLKPTVCENSQSDVLERGSDVTKLSDEGKTEDTTSPVTGSSSDMVNSGGINEETAHVSGTLVESVVPGVASDKGIEASGIVEGTDKGISGDGVMSSTAGQPESISQPTEESTDENKETKRRQEIEEQIQQIKELQKNTQPALPPLPQKQKYLYEPGKMPELPLKPPDEKSVEEAGKPSLHRQCGHYYNTQVSSIGQDENNECLSEEEYLQRLTRTVETFDALVVSLSQKRENAPFNGFVSEWKVLEKLQEGDSTKFSTQVATLNPSKNRYRDILPWDHTRVMLTTKEEGDYINANLIKKVTPLSPDYILTQGPIAATLGDFWLMVWERKAPVIVMLTKEVEGNRLKCHQYWPIDEGHTVVYGAIRVHMRRLSHCQAWIERIMHVQHAESDEVLVVSHLQFVGWPDHGVPHSPSDLLTFLSEVHNHHQEKDPQAQMPLVVHCSAGVGRAGTFCVVYSAIRELHGTRNIVNIPKLVQVFRKHRKFTVQKKEQYEFCYRAILYYANQFVQLEKAALAFKKAKVESGDQVDDVSNTSSETSLSIGQRKPDDVSFMGEISDEDSSVSLDEFDKDGNDFMDTKNSQTAAQSGAASVEMRERGDKMTGEGQEVKRSSVETHSADSSNIISNAEATMRTDCSTSFGETEGNLEVKESLAHDESLENNCNNKGCVVDKLQSIKTSAVNAEEGLEVKDSTSYVEELDDLPDTKCIADSSETIERSSVEAEDGLETKDLSSHAEEPNDFPDTKCAANLSDSLKTSAISEDISVTNTNLEGKGEMEDASLPEDDSVESLNANQNEASGMVSARISLQNEEIEGKFETEESGQSRELDDSSAITSDVDNDLENSFPVSAGIENLAVMTEEISENAVETNGSAVKKDDCYNERCDFTKNNDHVPHQLVEDSLSKDQSSPVITSEEASLKDSKFESDVDNDVVTTARSELQEQGSEKENLTAEEGNVKLQEVLKQDEKVEQAPSVSQLSPLGDKDPETQESFNRDDRQQTLSLEQNESNEIAKSNMKNEGMDES